MAGIRALGSPSPPSPPPPTPPGGMWGAAEDEALRSLVLKHGENQWARVAALLPSKSAEQCKERWREWRARPEPQTTAGRGQPAPRGELSPSAETKQVKPGGKHGAGVPSEASAGRCTERTAGAVPNSPPVSTDAVPASARREGRRSAMRRSSSLGIVHFSSRRRIDDGMAERGYRNNQASAGMSPRDDATSRAFTLSKFQEMFLAEEGYIDVGQLRELARGGIPDQVRGEVWKYLLGVPSTEGKESSSTFARGDSTAVDDPALLQRIAEDVLMYVKKHPRLRKKVSSLRLSALVASYVHSRPNLKYRPGMVNMMGTCAAVLHNRQDVYNVFARIHDLSDGIMDRPTRTVERLSSFMALFRRFVPSLSKLFIDEELHPNKWALQWIRNLLADSLPLKCALKAWDTYLSEKDGWNLHIYICIAILVMCEEDLQGLDQEDLCHFLRNLPTLDMDLVVLRAKNLKSAASNDKKSYYGTQHTPRKGYIGGGVGKRSLSGRTGVSEPTSSEMAFG